jgi:hypothetical protein
VNSSGNKAKSLPYPETTSPKIRIVRIKLPDYSIDAFAIERAPTLTLLRLLIWDFHRNKYYSIPVKTANSLDLIASSSFFITRIT